MAKATEQPTCSATTKAGKPCQAKPLQGTDRCISHSDEAVQAAAGFGGAENAAKGGAATKKPKLTELVRERLIEKADDVVDTLFAGLTAERAILVSDGERDGQHVEWVEDLPMRLRTVQEIFNRVDGRPKSSTEFSGSVEHRHTDQLDRDIEKLMRELAEVEADGSSVSS